MRQAWMLDRPAVRVFHTRDAAVTVGCVRTFAEKCGDGDGDQIGSVRLDASSLSVAPCGSAPPPPVVGVAAALFDFNSIVTQIIESGRIRNSILSTLEIPSFIQRKRILQIGDPDAE
jgi:hypothetical protein